MPAPPGSSTPSTSSPCTPPSAAAACTRPRTRPRRPRTPPPWPACTCPLTATCWYSQPPEPPPTDRPPPPPHRHPRPRAAPRARGGASQPRPLGPARVRGQVALAVPSPPYGASVHGHVRAGQGGVAKFNNRYSRDPVNLAPHGLDTLLDGITQILTGCAALLRPGGIVVVTARPWRHRGELVDLPSAVIAAGRAAGLAPIERCVALLAGLHGDHLVARPSFFQLVNVRKAP